MSKSKDERHLAKAQTGEFRSVRASVWRELSTVRDAATGQFKDSLVRKRPLSGERQSVDKKK